MKILQVNVVYKTGSTGRIVYDIHSKLKKDNYDSVVCYGRGIKIKEEGVYKVSGEFYADCNKFYAKLCGISYGGCFFSTNRLISVIKKEKPDIVHLHCLNGYFVNIYRLLNWLKNNNIRTVLTLHAEFMYTGGCSHSVDCNNWSSENGCVGVKCPRWHEETVSLFFDRSSTMWKRMKKAFEGFDNLVVTSVSPWLMERASRSTILKDKKHVVILDGVDTSVFHPYDKTSSDKIKKELGLTGERVVLHVTANFSGDPTHIKGGYYVIELAKRMPQVKFLVAGLSTEKLQLPENIILLGKITDGERLAKLYSMADLTLITSRRETFSMVTAESLCCGTPVVGFKAGAPEMITIEKFSKFSEYADVDDLEKSVKTFLTTDFCDVGTEAFGKYSKEIMAKNYESLYADFLNGVTKTDER